MPIYAITIEGELEHCVLFASVVEVHLHYAIYHVLLAPNVIILLPSYVIMNA